MNALSDTCEGENHPANNIMPITVNDKICKDGITYKQLQAGYRDSVKMHNFFQKVVEEYKEKSDEPDNDTYEEVKDLFYKRVYKHGKDESFRNEWTLFLSRVRYFEIIPKWEV